MKYSAPWHGTLPPPYPWKTIEVGETFKFSEAHSDVNARTSAYHMGKYYGRKFSVKKTPDGLICTRTA